METKHVPHTHIVAPQVQSKVRGAVNWLRVRLQAESLEDRTVLSQVYLSQGDLVIRCDDNNDSVIVRDYGDYFYQVTINGAVSYYSKPFEMYGGRVSFYGNGGSDYFENSTGLQAYLRHGGSGVDFLYGGWNKDTLIGGRDTDYIYGNDGHDELWGGDPMGSDDLQRNLWRGDDSLYGAVGPDYMQGDDGWDRLYGSWGNDTSIGNTGIDYLYGEGDNDVLDGGDDRAVDFLNGGSGSDWFQCEWQYRYRELGVRDVRAELVRVVQRGSGRGFQLRGSLVWLSESKRGRIETGPF